MLKRRFGGLKREAAGIAPKLHAPHGMVSKDVDDVAVRKPATASELGLYTLVMNWL